MVRIKVARSKEVLVQELSALRETIHIDWNAMLPPDGDAFYLTMNDQIRWLMNTFSFIRIREVCSIFHMSNRTYYEMFPRDLSKSQEFWIEGRPGLSSESENQELLAMILSQQKICDCMSPRECREWFAKLLSERHDQKVILDRFWWRRFMRRYSNIIGVLRCSSREAARANLTRDSIDPYVQAIRQMATAKPDPDLVISMDESGFAQRFMKGTQKNCVFYKDCDVKPRFLELADAHHVSIVGAITLSGKALQPMLISTRVTFPEELLQGPHFGRFSYVKTQKGYLNGDAMDAWVKNVLLPYVIAVRQSKSTAFTGTRETNNTAYLIVDGLKAHSTAYTRQIFPQAGIVIIELPPHGSHLYQPLDLSGFGVMKKDYRLSRGHKSRYTDEFARKIVFVLKAWNRASWYETIIDSWEEAGFTIAWKEGRISSILINETKIAGKVAN